MDWAKGREGGKGELVENGRSNPAIRQADSDIADFKDRREIHRMTKEALLYEILRLPPTERVEFLGDAWDAVAATPEALPVPEWHIHELEKRLAEPGPRYVSWDEVRSRLKDSR